MKYYANLYFDCICTGNQVLETCKNRIIRSFFTKLLNITTLASQHVSFKYIQKQGKYKHSTHQMPFFFIKYLNVRKMPASCILTCMSTHVQCFKIMSRMQYFSLEMHRCIALTWTISFIIYKRVCRGVRSYLENS